jgi:5-methylcytosine-specific restriction endonuclease McrA
MEPPLTLEEDYFAEFNARRKYAPESVISFTDFGIPALTESMVRDMIHKGTVVLTNYDNIKLCAMGNLIRKVQSSIQNPIPVMNLIRSILSLKEYDTDAFAERLDKFRNLINTMIVEQVECNDEPQNIDLITGGAVNDLKEPKKPKVKEPKLKAPKEPKVKEPKGSKELKESKVKEPKEPKVKEIKPKNKVEDKIETTKKQSIPKKVKDDVWNTYIGEGIAKHKCLCCKMTLIDKAKFDCGHVISEKNGGNLSIRNLRPICNGCNLSMCSENMIEYVKKHEYYIG